MTEQHRYLVVLSVKVDDPRPWWQALGLPDPVRWAEELPADVWATIKAEEEVKP